MSNPRQDLLSLLARRSFQLGQFKLSSGAISDYYVDCRTTTLHAEGAHLVGRVFLDAMRARGWKPEAIGGLTMGADPIVVAVAMTSTQAHPIHGFLVRKAEKSHGTGQRIEGYREKDAKVVIVDDVCTTGASTIQAIEAARAGGFEVIGAMCLVEREESGRKAVQAAAAPAEFISLFTADEVREEHMKLQEKAKHSGRGKAPIFAGSAKCDFCGRPAVTNMPSNRCSAHSSEEE
jgi:orotate phosphoribosyltransferase